MSEEAQEKKHPKSGIGSISQYAILGTKTTKHSDVEDTSSSDVQTSDTENVQDTSSSDVQKPKRIRQTVYLEKENDDYIRDSINAARRRTGKRVEISDMVNEALRRMREHE